jgi:hypothetical protein
MCTFMLLMYIYLCNNNVNIYLNLGIYRSLDMFIEMSFVVSKEKKNLLVIIFHYEISYIISCSRVKVKNPNIIYL